MAEAQSELQVLALGNYAVTGTNDFQLLLVARSDTDDQVVNEGTGKAVE